MYRNNQKLIMVFCVLSPHSLVCDDHLRIKLQGVTNQQSTVWISITVTVSAVVSCFYNVVEKDELYLCYLSFFALYLRPVCGVIWSWSSSVSIVSDYGSRFDPRQRGEDFSSSLSVQTGSGAHPAFCTMDTGGPFPGGIARPGLDADHSPQSSAEVMNE
jgi:hypothetical protein